MAKVIQLRHRAVRKVTLHAAKELQERSLFEEAMSKATRHSGIDFMKVITGDDKEKQRYRMKLHQETLNFK